MTNVSGYSLGSGSIYTNPGATNPGLTSIEMNELVELNELTVWDTPSINISMPKLPKTDNLYMYNTSSVTLNFASLERATRIDLNGGFLR